MSDSAQTNRLVVTRNLQTAGFGDRALVKLRWTGHHTYTFSASGALQSTLIDMNGVYQPGNNYSDTSNPQWWNRYAAVFANYRVLHSEVIVTANVTSAGTTTPPFYDVYLVPHTNATALTSTNEMMNTPLMKKWAFANTLGVSSTGLGSQSPAVRSAVSLPKLRGQTHAEYLGDSNNPATVTAAPAATCWWQIGLQPAGTATSTVNQFVVLDSIVEFFNKIPGDDSSYLTRLVALQRKTQIPLKRPESKLDSGVTKEEMKMAETELALLMSAGAEFEAELLTTAGSTPQVKMYPKVETKEGSFRSRSWK